MYTYEIEATGCYAPGNESRAGPVTAPRDPDFAEASRNMAAGIRASEETVEQRAFAEEHARHTDICAGCGACGDCGQDHQCQCADAEDADPRYVSEDDQGDGDK